jgi:hypothetical protein
MLLPLLATVALAAGLDDVRPRQLQGSAAAWATDADGRVVALVDSDDVLWVGSGKLHKLGALSFTPDEVVAGDPLVLSRTDRRGLVGTTDWAVLAPRGGLAKKGTQPGRLIGAAGYDGGAALLFPATLLLVDGRSEQPRAIPLPFTGAREVTHEGDTVLVEASGGERLVVGIADGCPVGLREDVPEDDLTAMLWRETARLCSAPPRLPDARVRRAKVQRDATIEQAIRDGDADLVAALQPPGGAEGLRPSVDAGAGAVRTREEAQVRIDARLQIGGGLTVVHTAPTPGMDLAPWAVGTHAPACAGAVVLAPSDPDVAEHLEGRVQAARAAGMPCAGSLRVARPGEVSAWKDTVFYVEPGGRVRGGRNGGISARRVRMDQAWLRADTDPLGMLAQAPELSPEWSEGPGPGFGPILDVDGSWVAGSGWDVLRGPFNAYRVERVALGGPISHLRVRRDGRIEVRSGGVVGAVVMEQGEVEWGLPLADSAGAYAIEAPRARPRPAVDPGPWRQAGDRRLQASAKVGGGSLELPVPIQHVENRSAGTVLYTELGLFGLDEEGTITWRLTDPESWVVDGPLLVGTTPFGVSAWRLPY